MRGRAAEAGSFGGPLEFAAYGVPGKAPSAWVNRNWAGRPWRTGFA